MTQLLRELGGAAVAISLTTVIVVVVAAAVAVRRIRAGWPAADVGRLTLLEGLIVLASATVAIVTLWPTPEGFGGVNLIPLVAVWRDLSTPGGTAVELYRLAGNVLLIAPLGFLLPIRFRVLDTWPQMAAVAVLVPTAIEVLQYTVATGRAADIDDVVFNAAGFLVGYGVWRMVAPWVSRLSLDRRGRGG